MKILIFLILKTLLLNNDFIPNNKKINIDIEDDKSFLINLVNENNINIKIKYLESGLYSYNIINKRDFDCHNNCDESDIKCDFYQQPKKAKFKFYEDQKNYNYLDFCYSTVKESKIFEDKLLWTLKKQNKDFNFTKEVDFILSGYSLKYNSAKFIINPDKINQKYLINNRDFKLNLFLEDYEEPLNINIEKNNIFFDNNIQNPYDFKILTNEKSLLKLSSDHYPNGKLIIKIMYNNNYITYNRKLKDLFKYPYDQFKLVWIEKSLDGTIIYWGSNFIKNNAKLIEEYNISNNKTIYYWFSINNISLKAILIVNIILVSLIIVAIILVLLLRSFIKKKNKKEEDDNMEYVKHN